MSHCVSSPFRRVLNGPSGNVLPQPPHLARRRAKARRVRKVNQALKASVRRSVLARDNFNRAPGKAKGNIRSAPVAHKDFARLPAVPSALVARPDPADHLSVFRSGLAAVPAVRDKHLSAASVLVQRASPRPSQANRFTRVNPRRAVAVPRWKSAMRRANASSIRFARGERVLLA